MNDQMLDLLIYGDVTRSYYDLYAGYENVKYRRLSDPNSGYQGPSKPRPVLTAYRGYEGPQAAETYYFEDGGWVNCLDGSQWNG